VRRRKGNYGRPLQQTLASKFLSFRLRNSPPKHAPDRKRKRGSWGRNHDPRPDLADQIEQLPESVEFICANFQPRVVQVEPVYQLGRGARAVSAETETFVEFFRQARTVAKQRGRDLIFSGVRVALSNHFCGATVDGFCLTPDGNVTSCYEAFSEDAPLAPRFFYGRSGVAPGSFEFDQGVLSALRSHGVENRAFCRECFARWTCAGDCLYKVLTASNGEELAGSGRCHVIRELTKDLILEKVAESGGLVWAGQQVANQSCWQAQALPTDPVRVSQDKESCESCGADPQGGVGFPGPAGR